MNQLIPAPLRAPAQLQAFLPMLPAVIAYLVLALLLDLAHPDRLNPDGVAYLRHALYLSQGDWADGISLYWSPLLPLLLAPFLLLGMDPLDAARLALGLAGLVVLFATALLLRRTSTVARWLQAVLLTAFTPALAAMQLFVIAPDLLLTGLLLLSAVALLDGARSGHGNTLFVAGALAGLAYWAKSYALPFALLFLPLSFLWLRRGSTGPRWRGIGILLTGWALVALPLVATLSVKKGSFTVGESGRINHAVIGPPDILRTHPVVFALPTPPHISIWETPEQMSYPPWSPFASREYFEHQVRHVGRNLGLIFSALKGLDFLALGFATLALGALVAWRWFDREETKILVWCAGATLVYCAGYGLVAFEPRYVQSFVFAFAIVAVGTVAGSVRLAAVLRTAFILVFSISCLATWIPQVQRYYTQRAPDYMRGAASELRAAGFQGPFATTSWFHGVALAFLTGEPHVGFPPDADPAVCARRLREVGARWIVVFELPFQPPTPVHDLYPPTIPRASAIVAQEGWQLRRAFAVSFGRAEGRIYAYERPD